MKQKVLILQVGNYADDVEFPKLSREINEQYAKLHGYDYKWETFEKNISFCTATSYKFIAISKYMFDYDLIIFIDADAAFVRPNINIEEYVDNEHYIYLAPDTGIFVNNMHLSMIGKYFYDIISQSNTVFSNFGDILENILITTNINARQALGVIATNPYALNSGFIIIKPHKDLKTLCDKLPVFIEFFNDFYHDQGCLTFMLQTQKYKKLLKILPDYTHGKMNTAEKNTDFYFNEDCNLIIHNYGADNESKLHGLITVKTNKYWAPYFNDLIPEQTAETE